jgi:transcriptional regulator with XRE-family HTH domain
VAVTPELWEHPELRAAVTFGDFAALVRASPKWAGQSQTAIASRCALSQPDISAIESGRRHVASAAVRARILDGLGVPSHLCPCAPNLHPAAQGTASDEAAALELAQRAAASDVGTASLDLIEGAFEDTSWCTTRTFSATV